MATQYTHTSLASAASFVSLRLSDPGNRFYQLTEVYRAIIEALRLWNVITSHDRARGSFATTQGNGWYDISTALKDAGGVLIRPRTITDSAIIAEIKTHLLEDNLATDAFSLAQIVDAVQWARDQFLVDTACVLTQRYGVDLIAAGGSAVFDYPDTVMSIRRAVFNGVSGRYWTLTRSDERAATAYSRTWQTPGTPRSFSQISSPSLRLRLVPPPSESGYLNTLVVASGAALDVTQATATILGVPDDYCWAVKWGAIDTLLSSEGPGSDPDRASRAAKMYQAGVQLARSIAVTLYAELDGAPVLPASIYRTDRFNNGWEGKAPGQPRVLSAAAPDLLALTPLPDGNPHSVLLDVVANTFIPDVANPSTTYLQVGRESLAPILGMAQWICTYKVGGAELSAADIMQQEFFSEANRAAQQRSAASTALSSMLGTAALPLTDSKPLEVDPTQGVRNADEIQQERNLRRRASTQ